MNPKLIPTCWQAPIFIVNSEYEDDLSLEDTGRPGQYKGLGAAAQDGTRQAWARNTTSAMLEPKSQLTGT